MSVASLDRLELCQQGLIDALDSHDIDTLEISIASLGDALSEVRAAGAWRDQPDAIQRASRIAALAEAARVRVNFLTDMTQRRLDRLSALRGHPTDHAYGPRGRLSA